MLKRVFLAVLVLVFILSVCSFAEVMQPTAKVVNPEKDAMSNNGLKARVAVADLKWGIGRGGGRTIVRGASREPITVEHRNEYADGLRDMLVTALMESGKYQVLERGEMSAIQEEMGLREQGYTDETGVKKGNIKGADLLITGAITAWEPGTEGIGGGISIPIPFGRSRIGASLRKSYLAMNVRIFDASTTEVIASKKVEGKSSDFGISTGSRGFPLSGSLGMFRKTPMEKAIQVCLDEVIRFIAASTPEKYCKY